MFSASFIKGNTFRDCLFATVDSIALKNRSTFKEKIFPLNVDPKAKEIKIVNS